MKKIFLISLLFCVSAVFAQSSSSNVGTWKTNCFQHQSNGEQGYAVETYQFDQKMNYKFTREIYRDASCDDVLIQTMEETGVVTIGKENLNNGFNPKDTKEAIYKAKNGKVDLGLIWVNSSQSVLKVARGISEGVQNNLLGLFEYKKVN